jgi:intracellular multiplication protein IcmF
MQHNIIKQLLLTIRRLAESSSEKNLSFLIATSLNKQGTSSVLKQANMQNIHIDEHHDLNIFYNKQGIILEINQNILNQMQWCLQSLFRKINRCHRHIKMSGFLFFIDISELLINDHPTQSQIIKNHIHHIHQFVNALDYPVRSGIIMTKLDQITGFTDYFGMAHLYELNDALGFSVPNPQIHSQFSQRFNEIWSNFIDNLNHGVIAKIHTTRGNKKRILIREFPLQIALLEAKFLHILKNINHPKAQIHGVYFTCSEQNGKNVNYLNQKIQNTLALVSPITSIQSVNYRNYFISGAIKHCQDLAMYVPKAPLLHDKNNLLSLSLSSIAGIGIVWMSIHSHLLLNDTAAKLKSHRFWSQNFNHHQKLSLLEASFENLKRIPFIFGQSPEINHLKDKINRAELKIYQNEVVPEISSIIQHKLQSRDLYQSYMALKAHKILMSQKKEESMFVVNWLEQHLQGQDKKNQLKLFKKMMWKVQWNINNNTVQTTQTLLNALPPAYLAYQIIHHSIKSENQKVTIPGFRPQTFLLPLAFTKEGFAQTEKALVNGLKQYQQDSWILGKNLPLDLEQKILETYTNQYLNYWKNIGNKLGPLHFNSFNEAHQLFANFEKQHSLEILIKLIIKETAPNIQKQHDVFNRIIASQFTELQLSNSHSYHLQQFWQDLKKFTNTFLVIDDHGQASFQYMRSYFNQNQYNDSLFTATEMAKHLPAPLSTWMQQITDDIWLCLYQSTKNYLNEEWNKQVYQGYMNDIKNFYPFNETGAELDIARFEEYFAPNGKIQHFYREYLSAFINTNQAQWQPKIINDKQFNIKSSSIVSMIQANVISNMFFPNNASNTRIQFSLEKMSLDPVIAQLKLHIGNQILSDNQQGTAFLNNITWPQMNASLHIQTLEGESYTLEEKGYWGLFKLLQQVNVLADPNEPSALQVLLEINGNSGRYLLKTSTLLNPFTPGILNHFELDEKIIN